MFTASGNNLSRKGYTTGTGTFMQNVPINTPKGVLIYTTSNECYLEVLEISSNNPNAGVILSGFTAGQAESDMALSSYDGSNNSYPFNGTNINKYLSQLFENLVYDTTNNHYKFSLKNTLYIPSGFELFYYNSDTVNTGNVMTLFTVTRMQG